MRRLVTALAVGVAMLAAAPSAGAQSVETFSSPTRAVAGAPMFVRSVTPCPATFGSVLVEVFGQLDDAAVEETHGDVAADGSWVVTVTAPSDMAAGITKSYRVTATCVDGGPTYGTRRLYVTGFGGDGATAPATGSAAASAPVSSELSSASGTSTQAVTKLQSVIAQAVESGSVAATAVAPEPTTTTWVSDEAERAAEARAELARLIKSEDDDVTLSVSPVVATTPRPAPDAGIPWWSFVLATMLAVGAVVGFGQRRRSAL